MRSFKPIIYLFVSVLILTASAAVANAPQECVKPFAVPSDSEPALGSQFVLKHGNPQDVISPGWFNPVVLPNSSPGADPYKNNIEGCNSAPIVAGQDYPTEPGNMRGPTTQGVSGLIGRDPEAYFDLRNLCVVTRIPTTPRIAPIPTFDLADYLEGGQSGRTTVKIIGSMHVFFEGMVGSDLVVRAVTRNMICVIDEPDGEISCNDGRDNDGDQLVDQEDPDCQVPR